MKKTLLALSFVALIATSAKADVPGFEWTIGSDFCSTYIWRGMNIGGLSAQPDIMLGFAGLQLEAWANLGLKNYSFKDFSNTNDFQKELDLTLSYNISGVKVGATEYHYFDGSRYFNLRDYDLEAYLNGTNTTDQLEVFLEFDLSAILEKIPLKFGWYTLVAGDDKYLVDPAGKYVSAEEMESITDRTGYKAKRAFSTYVELAYDIKLIDELKLTPTIGFTPWKSTYTDFEGKFAVNNISLKLDWEHEINEHVSIDLYALASINTYNINKENLFPPVADTYYTQRLNGVIGFGVWFF